ncbi:hypothetical protein KFE25_006268 [Diacronema lutheri]|uniref:PWWP domain-containing protein n=1 Tax=Diacronema lutheri TaxID=2081491 RepID=A0A8J5XQJ1_DIALT|nr:hypothetical protein KFE25_006268 [Diacronema lutheri]
MADFAPGEIAWVKMRGWPRWPCRVCDIEQAPSDVLAARTSTRPVLVHSFGDRKYVWAAASALTKYDPTAVVSAGNRLLQNAMIEAAQASGVAPPRMALAQPMRSKPEARARHTAAPQPAVAKPASSQPEHCPDRPAQHLRPRGRQPVLQSTFRHASKKRRTSKAAGLFLNLPPALLNGNISLDAADLFRARDCAYSLFSALDAMLCPFEHPPAPLARDDSAGEEAATVAGESPVDDGCEGADA